MLDSPNRILKKVFRKVFVDNSSTLIGALIAGLIGVGTTIYVEHLDTIKEENSACKIVALQMDGEIKGIRNLTDVNVQNPYTSIILSRIGESSDFFKYRATIADLLNQDELEKINNFYSDISRIDHVMDIIVQMTIETPDYETNTLFNDNLTIYWGNVEELKKEIEKNGIVAIENKLATLSGRNPYLTW